MWSDNETNQDFLNFKTVADTVAEMIISADEKPLSIGVSGGWGVGKSSMIKLIQSSLKEKDNDSYIFIEFNAWLYQGYDDAKAALMEVIAQRLVVHGEKVKTGLDKAKEFLGRVNWIRAISLTVGSAVSIAAGVPPIGLLGEVGTTFKNLTDGEISKADIESADGTARKALEEGQKLIKPPKTNTPPKEIQNLRNYFVETLDEMGVKVVVFVDDLDRCLPSTAIATLEAMRHFLFMKNTAFVIAADEKMIKHSVHAHFKGMNLEDDLVTNYFDKLIQVPIRVPPLGTQEVRTYLFLLFIQNSSLSQEVQENLRIKICRQLGEAWQGKRVDRKFIESIIDNCPEDLMAQLSIAERIAPIMTTARQIGGNPRLIKRFLNTLSIRLATARSQGVSVDEAALIKMLLFERCGKESAYSQLVQAINEHDEGKPIFLKKWEEAVNKGEKIEDLPPEWDDEFIKDWLALLPSFSGLDLRPVVYVCRDYMPIITSLDQMSPEGAELLSALLELKNQPSSELSNQLRPIGKRDISIIMEKLLCQAKQIQEWGTPSILYACLTVINADLGQADVFIRFLRQVPCVQLKPSIIPLLQDKPWASSILDYWNAQSETPNSVKRAINIERRGNV